jgi:hypothetical protein
MCVSHSSSPPPQPVEEPVPERDHAHDGLHAGAAEQRGQSHREVQARDGAALAPAQPGRLDRRHGALSPVGTRLREGRELGEGAGPARPGPQGGRRLRGRDERDHGAQLARQPRARAADLDAAGHREARLAVLEQARRLLQRGARRARVDREADRRPAQVVPNRDLAQARAGQREGKDRADRRARRQAAREAQVGLERSALGLDDEGGLVARIARQQRAEARRLGREHERARGTVEPAEGRIGPAEERAEGAAVAGRLDAERGPLGAHAARAGHAARVDRADREDRRVAPHVVSTTAAWMPPKPPATLSAQRARDSGRGSRTRSRRGSTPGLLQPDVGGRLSPLQRLDREHGLDHARGAERVAGLRLGAEDRRRAPAEERDQAQRLRAIVGERRGAVRMDDVDLARREARGGERAPRGERQALAPIVGEDRAAGVVGAAVTGQRDADRVAGVRAEQQRAGSLAQREAAPRDVEGAAGPGIERVEAAEAGHDELAQRVGADDEQPLVLAASDAPRGERERDETRGAGGRDHAGHAAQPELAGQASRETRRAAQALARADDAGEVGLGRGEHEADVAAVGGARLAERLERRAARER